MAFHKIDTSVSNLSKILDYTQYLKMPEDPCLRMYQSESTGFYNNIERISTINQVIESIETETIKKNSDEEVECQKK